jgi:serine/threonine protein kinase/tetratricopeptide (TPR) repeat protein
VAQCNGWYKLSDNPNCRRRELLDSVPGGTSYAEPHPPVVLRSLSILSVTDAGIDPGMPANGELSGQVQFPDRESQRDSFDERTTMATREELAEQIFLTVRALEPAQRKGVLEQTCAQDPELKQMVEERLSEEEEMGSFLEHPPLEFLHDAMNETKTATGNGDEAARPSQGRLAGGHLLNDRFVIVRFIAKGGMGEVYEAEDQLLHGPHIALKTILPEEANDPDLQHRFEQEVLSAREVVHPNLCPIYGIEHSAEPAPGFLFLTMKLLPGETLAARLRRSGPVRKEEGVAIVRQMAAGLAAIHAEGIVHRDIKTNNVMLDGAGSAVRLWITDFGLARALEAEVTVSGARILVAGTPGYIAPELHKGHPPSQASDLFAFGVVCHEVFTGERPVEKEDGLSVTPSTKLGSSAAPSFCVDLVKRCLDDDPKTRCEAFRKYLHGRNDGWTRRAFIVAATATACTGAVGGWIERERLYDLWHPLPVKRYVALLNWPKTSDDRVAPMLTGVLSAIKGELTRLEAFDRRLLVISPEDAHLEVRPDAHLKEVCDPLGANLALIAHGVPGAKYFELILRLLDPVTNRAIRERQIKCLMAEITSLPGKAVQAAEKLLDLSRYGIPAPATEPGTQSAAAFTAFQQAETLMKQSNDSGLDAAIEKYKDAVDLDPHYALAYARLGKAYLHLWGLRRDPGALDLARANCERALELDPDQTDGHLVFAVILDETGNKQAASDEFAKVLGRDPSNPDALLWQGQMYSRLNRWSDAEDLYLRAVDKRPNFWGNYNELGILYHKEGKFQQAIQAFREASVASPQNARPLSNLGLEYLQTGDLAAAKECLKKALSLAPDSDATLAFISAALRYQGKYTDALTYALKATRMNPGEDANWLELGECYASLHNRQSEAKSAYLQAKKEGEHHLQTNQADGSTWMLLALYKVKSGTPQDALSLIQKAESLGAGDMDSQLYKARMLELLGRRDEALATFAACFQRGATPVEVALFPDMQALRADPRYRQMVQSKSDRAGAGQLFELSEARNV